MAKSCLASWTSSSSTPQSFGANTALSYLTSGAVAKMDLRTGTLLAKQADGQGSYKPCSRSASAPSSNTWPIISRSSTSWPLKGEYTTFSGSVSRTDVHHPDLPLFVSSPVSHIIVANYYSGPPYIRIHPGPGDDQRSHGSNVPK